MTARANCKACKRPVLWLTLGTRKTAVDWPGGTGSIAAYCTETGSWMAWHAPPGDPVRPPYKRYQPHSETCPDAEPVPLTGAA